MMKKSTILALLLLVSSSAMALTPWKKGAFETGQYRNLLVEMGYSQADVDAKLKEVFNDVFRGPNKVYFEVGDSMGYVSDVKNHDARTEGMSYGLMIAVQFGEKDIFDRLWRWAKKYMQHQDGIREGYFAWSCKTDGTRNAQGAASDGELYFITALLFASNRWGNDTGINYKAEAQRILNCIQPKEYLIQRRSSSPLPPMDSDSAIPIPAIISPPSMRSGRNGPMTDVLNIGSSVPRRAVSICTRPSTRRLD